MPRAATITTTSRRLALAAVALSILAGCGGDDAATPSPVATTASAITTESADAASSGVTEPTATAAVDDGAVVSVASSDLGSILVDGNGLTLYAFDNDDVDTSACTEDCLDTWPPLLAESVEAGDDVTGEVGTFTREDGGVQVTINGMPLYSFAADAGPGDTQGQGIGEVWWVVDPAGATVTAAPGGTETSSTSAATGY